MDIQQVLPEPWKNTGQVQTPDTRQAHIQLLSRNNPRDTSKSKNKYNNVHTSYYTVFSSRQKSAHTGQKGSLILSHIGAHTVYYDNFDFFSITKLQIYDENKSEWISLTILYKSTMDSNKNLFDTTEPKIGHSWVGQTQGASTYIQSAPQ